MDNLHRALAPISGAAWQQIEEEAARTLRRYMGARRVVDVHGPEGFDFSSVNLGHKRRIDPPLDGVEAAQREVRAMIELRVPFDLSRDAIDDVERGSNDSDWQPVKDAARKLAYAEDSLVMSGYPAGDVQGMFDVSDNARISLSTDLDEIPLAISQAVDELRRAGVEGPYALVMGDEIYTRIAGDADDGYPLLKRIRNLLDRDVVWSPALKGAVVLSMRGGDFALYLGQDASVGYLSHDAEKVRLYLQETVYYQVLTAEAVVCLPAADD